MNTTTHSDLVRLLSWDDTLDVIKACEILNISDLPLFSREQILDLL